MAKNQIITIKIAELVTNQFVRQELDENRAVTLGDLIAGGIELDPIKITKNREVVDGRHRIVAHTLNEKSEIRAEVVEIGSEVELIAMAYRANTGGAKPPTSGDTEHTIRALLDRGMPKVRIPDALGLPLKMVRTYIDSIDSKRKRQVLMNAVSAVTDDGLTVAKAAEQYGVDLQRLKDELSGRRKKKGQNGVGEMSAELTSSFKSIGNSTASLLRKATGKFEDGDLTAGQVLALFEDVERLQKLAAKAVADRRKRFEAVAVLKKEGIA